MLTMYLVVDRPACPSVFMASERNTLGFRFKGLVMRIVNVLDIDFYRPFLSKIYLTAGVEYEFFFPENGDVGFSFGEAVPDAVLIQDSYMAHGVLGRFPFWGVIRLGF